MRKVLFFVNTHYQFMLASIIRMQKYSCDYATLILGVTSGLKEMYDKNLILVKDIFDEVYWTDEKEMKKNWKLHIYDWKKVLVDKFGNTFSDYDEVFFYNITATFGMVYKSLATSFHKFSVHWYEEGYTTYILGDKYITEFFPMQRIIDNLYLLYTWIVFRGFHPSYIAKGDAWFVKPEWVIGKMHRKVRKMFSHTPNQLEKEKVLRCYSYYDYIKPIRERVIFLGESFDEGGMGERKEYGLLIEKIAKHVGYENFLYKEHPRNPVKITDSRIHIFDLSIPWEVIELSQDLKDKICIISVSGASVNSKYVFETKGKVISLWPIYKNAYRLLGENMVETEKFMKRMTVEHSDFQLIGSEKELMDMLDLWLEKL